MMMINYSERRRNRFTYAWMLSAA